MFGVLGPARVGRSEPTIEELGKWVTKNPFLSNFSRHQCSSPEARHRHTPSGAVEIGGVLWFRDEFGTSLIELSERPFFSLQQFEA